MCGSRSLELVGCVHHQTTKHNPNLIHNPLPHLLPLPQELELLVCGSRSLDLRELEAATRYEDGYTKHSEVCITDRPLMSRAGLGA